MNSRLSVARTEFAEGRWVAEPPMDEPSDPDLVPSTRSSRAKRVALTLFRFLITLGTGVAATLAWQSYGDAAREKVAGLFPQLGWLAPQAAAPAGAAPDQLKSISRSLAAVRQSVDKLAAEITKVQATKQDTPDKPAAPPPLPAAGPPARKPVPSPSPSPQMLPVR